MKGFLTKIIIAGLALITTSSSYKAIAQQTEQGYIKYTKSVNWSKMLASVDYISKERADKMAYMFGNETDWKTNAILYFSKNESKYEDIEDTNQPDMYSSKKQVFFMHHNFLKGKMSYAFPFNSKTYIINDSLQTPAWKVLNDMKEVAGHICMNATYRDELRKQNIVAWFALDIPTNIGPERFIGLPGAILEVDINNGAMVIWAENIVYKNLTNNELSIPSKVKGKNVSVSEYSEILKKHYEEQRKAERIPFGENRY